MSGHEVMEVWSNEFDKWILLDATTETYAYDPDTGVVMNTLEVHDRLKEKVPRIETWQRPFRAECENNGSVLDQQRIAFRQGDNRFCIYDDLEAGAPFFMITTGHFRMPLRNDFMSREYPVPVAQGGSMWGWDGYLNFYDEKFPRRREFQRQTNRPQDFYYSLNQSQLTLSLTDRRDTLRVDIETYTPCFDTFLVRIDNDQWQENDKSYFNWSLHEGLNRLWVRTRNTMDVLGPASFVSVVMNN